MKYEVILYWSNEDDSYIAEVPELPGCMPTGRHSWTRCAMWKSSQKSG